MTKFNQYDIAQELLIVVGDLWQVSTTEQAVIWQEMFATRHKC